MLNTYISSSVNRPNVVTVLESSSTEVSIAATDSSTATLTVTTAATNCYVKVFRVR